MSRRVRRLRALIGGRPRARASVMWGVALVALAAVVLMFVLGVGAFFR